MALELRKVKNTFDLLFGKDVEVQEGSSVKNEANRVIGTYKNDNGEECAAIVFDTPLACYSGAALSMLPVGVAEDCISSGNISDMILENIHEVFNISVRFFSDGTSPDMRLGQLLANKQDIPDNILEILENGASLDIQANIPGYGSGCASIYRN